MRCDDDATIKQCSWVVLQISPSNAVLVEYAMSAASRIHDVVPLEKVTVPIGIQRGLYRVPAGVYACIGHKVIIDPVGIRRVRSCQDSSGEIYECGRV